MGKANALWAIRDEEWHNHCGNGSIVIVRVGDWVVIVGERDWVVIVGVGDWTVIVGNGDSIVIVGVGDWVWSGLQGLQLRVGAVCSQLVSNGSNPHPHLILKAEHLWACSGCNNVDSWSQSSHMTKEWYLSLPYSFDIYNGKLFITDDGHRHGQFMHAFHKSRIIWVTLTSLLSHTSHGGLSPTKLSMSHLRYDLL